MVGVMLSITVEPPWTVARPSLSVAYAMASLTFLSSNGAFWVFMEMKAVLVVFCWMTLRRGLLSARARSWKLMAANCASPVSAAMYRLASSGMVLKVMRGIAGAAKG